MDGRETDDDDTLERHTDTNKLTGHTASWAATHPEWTYTSLKATFPLAPPPAPAVPRDKPQQTNTDRQQQTNTDKQATGANERVRLKDCSASSNLAGREARTRPCVGSCEASMDALLSGYPPAASPNSSPAEMRGAGP